jgi:hypothetical protein
MYHIASYTVTNPSFTGAIYMLNFSENYQHLQVRITGRSKSNSTISSLYGSFYRDGVSTPSSYASHYLYTDGGGTVGTGNNTGLSYMFAGTAFPAATAPENLFSTVIIDVLDYTSTTKNKTVRKMYGHDRNGSGYVALTSSLLVHPNAVNSCWIDTEGSFAVGTRIDIYGINSNPNATGA